MLYPLKFEPIIIEKVWGGKKLSKVLNKKVLTENAGESWEISGVKNNLSIVSNGKLKDKNILDVIKKYKEQLLGKKVYEVFGDSFPLLIKFIDASDDLSVQVHPDDKIAQERHNENGKTEIWYIIDADKDSNLVLGLNKNLSKAEYNEYVKTGKLKDVLNSVIVKSGDVAYIPAGRIHAIRKGVFLAEIQQTSDLTYRIYDWDRKDLDGTYRTLHNDMALDVVDLKKRENYLTNYKLVQNVFNNLIKSKFFNVNICEINKLVKKDYTDTDSFIILINIAGEFNLKYEEGSINVMKGETILIPACLKHIDIVPISDTKILEVFI